LKANGFGSFFQIIVIRAAVGDSEALSETLGITTDTSPDDPGYVLMRWTRLSRQLGDDDAIVSDLFRELGDLAHSADWRIDWGASDY
jgi:hypothetical protein